ncbi:cyclopropane-fatty-acyl-phospholipid synthase family protein [Ramlibacter sp. WS9]|uniref:SAM-dependent methyltransferase n=1 Tax=Ramlibacter sp. WS9 TaxID=1882741 RepID=UPI0011443262|nr:class I SAM-dependent methyltransferase [Ramlibacter sp. WS9]ROZ79478.1 class I SAM-dependent methyltransferase [Ramlibacter sp. WS9]
MYDKDPLTALEAVTAAQRLAFGPLAFQATAALRDRGVLAALAKTAHTEGSTIDEVCAATGLSAYAVRVLLEAGLGLHIVWRRGGHYFLGKLGRFLLDDEMTRVNFDFTRDVCYQAAAHLGESLEEGRPAGLKELGPWATLYEGLSVMPEPALTSWHAFDHFYSDGAFPVVCERLAAQPPLRLMDIGCNTGKWARMCLKRLPSLEVGLVDLEPQLQRARAHLEQAGLGERATYHAVNLLDDEAPLPGGHDMAWMSQFLDCFSDDEIVAILRKVREALVPGGRVWILELFWDRQRFEAAAFSLQQTSLYFTCVANGNSQMYDSSVFLALVERAGLEISAVTDGVGGYHTLLECRVAA